MASVSVPCHGAHKGLAGGPLSVSCPESRIYGNMKFFPQNFHVFTGFIAKNRGNYFIEKASAVLQQTKARMRPLRFPVTGHERRKGLALSLSEPGTRLALFWQGKWLIKGGLKTSCFNPSMGAGASGNGFHNNQRWGHLAESRALGKSPFLGSPRPF